MQKFKFPKINATGKIEGETYILEKYDGAQASIHLNNDGIKIYNKGKFQKPIHQAFSDCYNYFLKKYYKNILEKYGKEEIDKYVFHGESMKMSFRSSSIIYETIPRGCFVCFAIQEKNGKWLHPLNAKEICESLEIPFAQIYWSTTGINSTNLEIKEQDIRKVAEFLSNNNLPSSLGGLAEGVVTHTFIDQKIKFKKFPRLEFREIHMKKKSKSQSAADLVSIVKFIGEIFASNMRFSKGVQKYKIKYDSEELDREILKDIIWEDIIEEEREYIEYLLFNRLLCTYAKFGRKNKNICTNEEYVKILHPIVVDKKFNKLKPQEESIKKQLFNSFEKYIKAYLVILIYGLNH